MRDKWTGGKVAGEAVERPLYRMEHGNAVKIQKPKRGG